MLIFGLSSTSDDWPSNLVMKVNQNAKKRSPKSSKNEMLVLGLHSTSDNWLSDLSDKK